MTNPSTLVLTPLGVDAFFTDIWEQQHHHIKREKSSHFSELLSIADIETYLSTQEAYFPSVQAVHSERDIGHTEYTDDSKRVLPQSLAQLHRTGATLIVSDAQKRFPPLANLCRAVTGLLQMRCQTNVYLSPPGNQGFHSHYDTHDVFILQVSGTKTFRFYPSDVQLPFPDDVYDPEQNPHTNIVSEATLSAGDTLYIPRGLVHDAIAHQTESSLHVTLGVFPKQRL